MKAILAVAVLAPGCALHPVPKLQLEASSAAIERASAGGGQGFAGADLRNARDKMELARHLSAGQDNKPARWLAEQAEVDAQLAEATAATRRALREAEGWQQSLRALRADPIYSDR